MNFSQRLKAARKYAGLTQKQLADAAGVSQPVISQIENGASLKSVHTSKLATACRVDLLWLSEGIGEMLNDAAARGASSTTANRGPVYNVPLIALSQVHSWISGGYKTPDFKIEEYLPCPVPVGPRAFAFRMPNDSMIGPRPDKSIFEGWAVFVDPDTPPQPGQVALASIKGADPILGVLTPHGGHLFIKPANSQFVKEEVDSENTEWCLGRAVFTGYSM